MTEEIPDLDPVEEAILEPVPVEEERTLKFKKGDKEYEVPVSALYEHEAKDGQKLEITAEEMARSPWAQSDIHKKYSEIDKQKKDLERWGEFRDRLVKGKDNLQGYDKVASIIQDMIALNPDLSKDIQEFEAEYAKQIVDYMSATEEGRQQKAQELKARELERENKLLKSRTSSDLQEYSKTKANAIIEKFAPFGVDLKMIDQMAINMIKDGHIDPISDKRSIDTALSAINEALEAELGPKRDKTLADLNKAMDIVEKISPSLVNSQDAVMDAYKLLIEKGLPADKVLKKLSVMYEETLPDESKSKLEKQRDRVTGKKEPATRQEVPKRNESLIRDPEEAFRKGLY
jgi:hypothetical protein